MSFGGKTGISNIVVSKYFRLNGCDTHVFVFSLFFYMLIISSNPREYLVRINAEPIL